MMRIDDAWKLNWSETLSVFLVIVSMTRRTIWETVPAKNGRNGVILENLFIEEQKKMVTDTNMLQ